MWVLEGEEGLDDRQGGTIPGGLAPLEAQHPLEHTRQVREAHMGLDTYSNRLPRAVKGKSERAPAGGRKHVLKERRGLVEKTKTWEI